MSLYNELLDWCKSNCGMTTMYYEDIVNSLSSYLTSISSQSNCFVTGFRYYANPETQIIWIYCGVGKDLYTDNAAAITIDCNAEKATFSYYKILNDESIPDIDTNEKEYWKCIEEWRNNNYVFEKLSILSAINKFNVYADVNIKVSLEEPSKIVSDFVYRVDDSNKLKIQLDCNSIDEFFLLEQTRLAIVSVDTNEQLIKIMKDSDTFIFIVDIAIDDIDRFILTSKLTTKTQLNKLISDTVNALRHYEQFARYADELENCLV